MSAQTKKARLTKPVGTDVAAYSFDGNWACLCCVAAGKHKAAIREMVSLGYRMPEEDYVASEAAKVSLEPVSIQTLKEFCKDGISPICNVCGKTLADGHPR